MFCPPARQLCPPGVQPSSCSQVCPVKQIKMSTVKYNGIVDHVADPDDF